MIKRLLSFILLLTIGLSISSCTYLSNHSNPQRPDTTETLENDVSHSNAVTDFVNEATSDNNTIDITSEQNLQDNIDYETLVISNGNGGTQLCTVHSLSYHTYGDFLIQYVGREAFREWIETTEIPDYDNPNGCLYPDSTIYAFIKYFDIPIELMISNFNSNGYTANYEDNNIDLLYYGTSEEAEQYYREMPEEIKLEKLKFKYFDYIKKFVLIEYSDIFGNTNDTGAYSIIQMLRMTDTNLDFFKMQSENIKSGAPGFKNSVQFEYNYDLYESKTGEELDEMIENHSPFYLDCLFCGITPYETKYEKQAADNQKYGIIDYSSVELKHAALS